MKKNELMNEYFKLSSSKVNLSQETEMCQQPSHHLGIQRERLAQLIIKGQGKTLTYKQVEPN